MKKLVNGIIDFRRNVLKNYKDKFAHLALGQSPEALYIGCSDSRVTVDLFASTGPGDLFITRNVGNLVPPWTSADSCAGNSEGAAIEYALSQLNVADIIVCGHSECGAMHALCDGRSKIESPNLKSWLRHGDRSLDQLEANPDFASEHNKHNRLSQLNVIQQIEHLKSYPIVQQRLNSGKLKLHGWWFEIDQAKVYAFAEDKNKFVAIDEANSN